MNTIFLIKPLLFFSVLSLFLLFFLLYINLKYDTHCGEVLNKKVFTDPNK